MQQLPLLVPDSRWTPPTCLPNLKDARLIAIDVETKDERLTTKGCGGFRGDGELVGVSVASDSGFVGYYPLRHPDTNNFPERHVLGWLGEQLSAGASVVGHNLGYDLEWLRVRGLRVRNNLCDSQVAAALLDESRNSYRLDDVGFDYLGERKDERLLAEAAATWGVHKKHGLWQLPARYVGQYAEQDAVLALKLWQTFEPQLEAQGLMEVYRLEAKLIYTILNMRERGVRIDIDAAERLVKTYMDEWTQAKDDLRKMLGWAVDVHSGPDLEKAFKQEGIEYPRTAKGNASFTAPWLERQTHALGKGIVKVRQLRNMADNYAGKLLDMQVNGRIYATFRATQDEEGGTETGRFSMSNPNLQQIPGRNPRFKKDIRGLFIPEDGLTWLRADYSQQEYRWAAELAVKARCEKAEDALRMYVEDEKTDFHQMVADLTGLTRKVAKPLNLGILYGMGKQKLANQVNMPLDQAASVLDQYHSRLPWVRELSNTASRRAQDRGYTRTYLGRRRRFDLWEIASFETKVQAVPLAEAERLVSDPDSVWYNQPIRRAYTHKALNSVIQGSSADQTKMAMVQADEEGIPIQITVHDELDTGMADPDQQKRLVEIMKTVCKTTVPFYVGVDVSRNWGVGADD